MSRTVPRTSTTHPATASSSRATRQTGNLWDPGTTLCIYPYQCRCTGVTKRGSRCMNRVNKDDIQKATCLLKAMARRSPSRIPSEMLMDLAHLTLCLRWHRTSAQADHLVYSWEQMIDDYCTEVNAESTPRRREARAVRIKTRTVTISQTTTTIMEPRTACVPPSPVTQSDSNQRSSRRRTASPRPPSTRSSAQQSAKGASRRARQSQSHDEELPRRSSTLATGPSRSVRRAHPRPLRSSTSTTDVSSNSESSTDSDATSDSEDISDSGDSSASEDDSDSEHSSDSGSAEDSEDDSDPHPPDSQRIASTLSSTDLTPSRRARLLASSGELRTPASTPASSATPPITLATTSPSIATPTSASSSRTPSQLQGASPPASPRVHRRGYRQPLDPTSTCPICFEAITSPEAATYCRAQCGGNVHTGCFVEWRDNCFSKFEAEEGIREDSILSPAQCTRKYDSVTCVYCRIIWRFRWSELIDERRASGR